MELYNSSQPRGARRAQSGLDTEDATALDYCKAAGTFFFRELVMGLTPRVC